MSYDPTFPRQHYDDLADEEWSRMTSSRRGELSFLVHMDVFSSHLNADMHVLEIGAGAGIFTKELVHMVQRLVVADISPVQLELNQQHMSELGQLNLIDEYRVLDLADLSDLEKDSFDAVVCVGGPLSYLLDKESVAIHEILDVLRPSGIAIIGVMSLINTLIRLMGVARAESDAIGIDNMRWLLETGVQDREHHPYNEHFCHMMTSSDMETLLDLEQVDILERRAPGLLGMATEDALNDVHEDSDLWGLIVERELAWSKLPGALDLGDNIVYVVRKREPNHRKS